MVRKEHWALAGLWLIGLFWALLLARAIRTSGKIDAEALSKAYKYILCSYIPYVTIILTFCYKTEVNLIAIEKQNLNKKESKFQFVMAVICAFLWNYMFLTYLYDVYNSTPDNVTTIDAAIRSHEELGPYLSGLASAALGFYFSDKMAVAKP
jgi:hypothetical protein